MIVNYDRKTFIVQATGQLLLLTLLANATLVWKGCPGTNQCLYSLNITPNVNKK
jgi:hypothetical protein